MYGHIRGLECCRRPPHTRLAMHPSNGLLTTSGRAPDTTPVPAAGLNPEPTCALLFHCAVVLNTLVKEGGGGGQIPDASIKTGTPVYWNWCKPIRPEFPGRRGRYARPVARGTGAKELSHGQERTQSLRRTRPLVPVAGSAGPHLPGPRLSRRQPAAVAALSEAQWDRLVDCELRLQAAAP